jgi:murein L,D-transpeptidase YcbB/YkuD
MDERTVIRFLVLLLLSLPFALPASGQQAVPATAPDVTQSLPGSGQRSYRLPMPDLRDLLSSGALPALQIGSERVSQLKNFYASRAYTPIWVGPAGIGPGGSMLLARLDKVAAAGAPSLTTLVTRAQSRAHAGAGQPLAALELLLSAAFLDAAIDSKDPAGAMWRPEILLEVADSPNILLALREWLPVDPAFWRLRAAVQDYRRLEAAGGWPSVPPGPKLELGVIDARVAPLRRRLLITGDLAAAGPGSGLFDIALHAAVSRFQARHGLEVDGIVGKGTIAELNVTVEERLAAMNLNLRRLRQQQREWGQRYVAVNIAAASYRLVDRGQEVFERAAIVGRSSWPTPQLDSLIDRLEFNPDWTVPPRIARLELLPIIRRDPNYMRNNDMYWINGQIRQRPGPKNPLGKVKFLFPNPYSVYLHDTSNPQLFQRWNRFLSHGCVRIALALDLAAYLLKDDPQWPAQRIDEALRLGRTVPLRLAAPIPIHVVYDTAWVDQTGIVQFRPDAYGEDGGWISGGS